ncbi:hypothetical protein PVIIG_06115 [Plasmodium vivax India VII]|uniref:VIR protein n=1 Tax=Plasmodium vivax India VII TaxID=1077284 RepID=A0A0J9S370_PLAVI|nr:hypothetical protein PVIIG_06115 [Plasmodium vivax India VII]
MSENILNIGTWKDDYPFLGNVWTTYNNFDIDVDVNDNRNNYYSLCHYILKDENGGIVKYSDFCMKILRNLGYLSVVHKNFAPTSERCNMLYNWIYNSIDEKKITENIVDKCFKMYTDDMEDKGLIPNCSKLSYENYFEEPKKMTLLQIFEYNMQIIIDILKDKSYPDNIPWRKFICECVMIYKHMNDKYCPKRADNEKHETTCLRLEQFKRAYSIFRGTLGDLKTSIPSLDDLANEVLVKCPPGQNQVLTPKRVQNTEVNSSRGIFQAAGDHDPALAESLSAAPQIVDSSMKKNITTTIAGRLVNPRLKRNVGRTNNNFYSNGESELLFYESAPGDINTYNIGYEAA